MFGHYDIPCVLVTGDYAACREAQALLGEQCVTAAVKFGYGRQCCRMLAPQRTHALIKAAAREALSRVATARPFKLALPMQARLETLAVEMPETASFAEIAAAPHQVHEGRCETQLEVYSFDPPRRRNHQEPIRTVGAGHNAVGAKQPACLTLVHTRRYGRRLLRPYKPRSG